MKNIFRKMGGAPRRAFDAIIRRKLISAIVGAVLTGAVAYEYLPQETADKILQPLILVIDALIALIQ